MPGIVVGQEVREILYGQTGHYFQARRYGHLRNWIRGTAGFQWLHHFSYYRSLWISRQSNT